MRYEAGFLVRTSAQKYGDQVAVQDVATERTLSFRALNASANALGSGLQRRGIQRGERVALLSFNRIEVIQTWVALEKRAMVRVALHTHTPAEDHRDLLNHVETSALIFDTRFVDTVEAIRADLSSLRMFVAIGDGCPSWAVPFGEVLAEGSEDDQILEVDEDDPCSLQLTSGTTGMSKPWLKTYRSWQAVITHNLIHLDTFDGQPAIDSSDVNLHFHPLQWATGFQTLYPYLLRGARTLVLPDEPFDAGRVVDVIEREQVTGTFAPGPLLSPILDEVARRGGINHGLRRVVVFFGSAELLDRTTELLGPVWAHAFGSTEQGAATTRLLPSEVAENRGRIDSVGCAGSPNFELAIVAPDGERLPAREVGEIVVRSAMSEGRYWGMAESTALAYFPGDWFRSGDVGYVDEDGFLYYSDRAGDTIMRDGQAIYPHVVEAVLLADDAVANCGVVDVGAGDFVDVVAAVLLKDGHTAGEALASRLTERLTSAFKEPILPIGIEFVAEVPTVLGGAKVQRGALREQLKESRK